jgi:hypothetical protein
MTATLGRSCEACPSYLDADEVRERFGKSTGAPGCARFGHILGVMTQTDEERHEVAKAFAAECKGFSQPRPEVGDEFEPRVANPDPMVLAKGFTGETLNSCANCTNQIKSEAVYPSLGWPVPLCRATGRLIFKPLKDCRGCPYASPGGSTMDVSGINVRVELKPGFRFSGTKQAMRAYYSSTKQDLDPSEYPTDVPVSTEDEALGIRAWRKVPDPYGEARDEVFLPIFRKDAFSDIEQEAIPQAGDEQHPELYIDHANLLFDIATDWVQNDTTALFGAPGDGKSEAGRFLAWLCGVPYNRISIYPETEIDDLIGKWLLEGGETKFHMGRFVHAWKGIGALMLEEPNTNEEVWPFFRPLTDNNKQFAVDAAKGEIFSKNDYCFFLMSMNPSHDPRNLGTIPLSDADGSRLSKTYVPPPPEDIERHIIRERVKVMDDYDLSDVQLDTIMKIAKDIRSMCDPQTGSLSITWGVRRQIQVARKLVWYPYEKAYRRAVLDDMEKQAQDQILESIRSYVGRK